MTRSFAVARGFAFVCVVTATAIGPVMVVFGGCVAGAAAVVAVLAGILAHACARGVRRHRQEVRRIRRGIDHLLRDIRRDMRGTVRVYEPLAIEELDRLWDEADRAALTAVQVMAATTAIPSRTVDQRRQALVKANRIRCLRADFKRSKPTPAEVASLLIAEPWWADTMKVADVLVAPPKWGSGKARKTMVRCRVSESKTVGGLSGRQRREVVEALLS